MEEQLECHICLDPLYFKPEETQSSDSEDEMFTTDKIRDPTPVLLQCGHVLHRKCLKMCFKANPRERLCPVCRADVSERLTLRLVGFKSQFQCKELYLQRLQPQPKGELSSKQVSDMRKNIALLKEAISSKEAILEKRKKKKRDLNTDLSLKMRKVQMNQETIQRLTARVGGEDNGRNQARPNQSAKKARHH